VPAPISISKGCSKVQPLDAQKVCSFKIKFWKEALASKSEIDISQFGISLKITKILPHQTTIDWVLLIDKIEKNEGFYR
jgi:hypothetical protein